MNAGQLFKQAIQFLIFSFCFFLLISLVSCDDEKSTFKNPSSMERFMRESGIELDSTMAPFYFGVASGDPTTQGFLIWTQLLPDNIDDTEIEWEVATDLEMENVVKEGSVEADSTAGYSIKLEITGLEAGRSYYYQFENNEKESVVGRTRTLSNDKVDSLSIVYVSCSNYQFGPFNGYMAISKMDDVDAVVHLGDYIYEYGEGDYGDTTTGRLHIPEGEIINLSDYRLRYAQYHTDKGLQAVRKMHPMLTIWDDHEFTNNAYITGAQNHQEEEGDWEKRKNHAVQAYFEWLPVGDQFKPNLYRSFDFNGLAKMVLLEGRTQRSKQAENESDSVYSDPNRVMIGENQELWLKEQLSSSEAAWNIIANQVMFSDVLVGHIHEGRGRFMDMWSGYPVQRKELLEFIDKEKIKNLMVFTGDFHSSLAAEFSLDPRDKTIFKPDEGHYALGTEFVVHSINSANYNEYRSDSICYIVEEKYKDLEINPHVRYTNMRDHGFVHLLLTDEVARISYHFMEHLKEVDDKEKAPFVMWVSKDRARIEFERK